MDDGEVYNAVHEMQAIACNDVELCRALFKCIVEKDLVISEISYTAL